MCRPARTSICAGQRSSGSTCATSTATVANGPTALRQRHRPFRAHAIERHRSRRYRRRVAVLQPQDHLLVVARRRQAGVAIRRPGVGVVRARQAGARGRGVACIRVERVFHHVVSRRTDRVQEQLAGERGQTETFAHDATVDGEAARSGWNLLLPGLQHACRPHRTAAATDGSRRRRSLPSSSPTPTCVDSPSASRKNAKFVAKFSLSR